LKRTAVSRPEKNTTLASARRGECPPRGIVLLEIKTREVEAELRRAVASEKGDGGGWQIKMGDGRHEEEAKSLTFALFSPMVVGESP
jgi:hypothetical protein